MTMTPISEHANAVAIIGMAARLPGAPDVGSYWLNLREGVESITRHTREESLAAGARPDLLDNPNYVNASGALAGAECFDARFFNYSSREASIMDPQHRVFLECAYHAMEDAACDSRRYQGTVGVYAGCTMNTYLLYNVMARTDDIVATVGDLATMVGNDKDFLSTRVSHRLNLRGPSVAVQTACSSSLVAIHLAARAVLDGECDMALAGGASVRMPIGAGYLANPGGTSSLDGHCRTFDVDAAGSVVGNGVGVVALKRLADARRDGDQIHAVIRGSAINNDGGTKASFTAPSVDGQSRAVVRALTRAGVSARDIAFVEAHGTGTPLGDPIEVAALSRAFREWTGDRAYCWLGSVKPNIGHLDAAAGVAGLIKAVLALKHRKVPPVVNFRSPNPRLELESTPFLIPAELSPLNTDGPLLASVNSLAMGGTNAHVVLEEAPAPAPSGPSRRRRHAVSLSARTPEALETMSRTLGQWVREHPGTDIADAAYTLGTGRPELEYRRVILAQDLDDIGSALSATGSRRQRSGRTEPDVRVAFVFPGQGAQRVGMGATLAAHDPVFAGHLDTVLDLFRTQADLDVGSALYPPTGDPDAADAARTRLAGTDLTQPALFAVEWAAGRTLLDYGVRPYAMLGHSIGELVAAALGGVLPLPEAVTVVALRGRVLHDTPDGAMLYVNLPPDEVSERIADESLTVAAINAPALVVVAGAPDTVDRFADALRAEGVSCGRLEVTRAFHSPSVEPAAQRLRAALAERDLRPPQQPIVSNVTGRYLTVEQATSAEYWAEQVRRPVRFADGVRTLVDDGVTVFLEVGPGRSLGALIRAVAPEAGCLPVLAGDGEREAPDLLDVLAGLWLRGGSVDLAAYYQGESRRRLSLPLYPFERTRHWLDPVPSASPRRVVPAAVASAEAPAPTDAGRTPMQRYLIRLWHTLLGTEHIGLHDSFFDLDGTSLLAMQLVTQLRKDGAIGLELTALFEMPTVAALAVHLEELGFTPPDVGAAMDPPPDQATPAGGDPYSAVLAEVAALSDDEVQARLAELESGAGG